MTLYFNTFVSIKTKKMEKTGILLIAFALILVSCEKKAKKHIEKLVIETTDNISFTGKWTRSFEMGNDVSAKVIYDIWNDSIQYTMQGPMLMKYTIKKDTFVSKDNKWIGKKDGTSYVIFVKNTSKDSISLLKMKVESKSKALGMKFPSDTARSKFSSWNTYFNK